MAKSKVKKVDDREIDRWVTINGRHVPVDANGKIISRTDQSKEFDGIKKELENSKYDFIETYTEGKINVGSGKSVAIGNSYHVDSKSDPQKLMGAGRTDTGTVILYFKDGKTFEEFEVYSDRDLKYIMTSEEFKKMYGGKNHNRLLLP